MFFVFLSRKKKQPVFLSKNSQEYVFKKTYVFLSFCLEKSKPVFLPKKAACAVHSSKRRFISSCAAR